MKQGIFKNLKAFTLIEMLLVIVLIGVITSVSVLALRNSAQQARIDKVALKMQSVLQAAMAYQTANQMWPPASAEGNEGGTICPTAISSTLPNFSTFTQLGTFVGNYFPNGVGTSQAAAQTSTQSSIGAPYCWAPDGLISTIAPPLTNPPYAVGMFDPTAARFWVALQVPGTGAAAYQFAQRLAAKLPNALLLTNPTSPTSACSATGTGICFVRSEVPKPGTGSGAAAPQIVASGTCRSDTPSQTGVNSTCTSAIVTPINVGTDVPACDVIDTAGNQKALRTCPAYSFTINFACPANKVGLVQAQTTQVKAGYCSSGSIGCASILPFVVFQKLQTNCTTSSLQTTCVVTATILQTEQRQASFPLRGYLSLSDTTTDTLNQNKPTIMLAGGPVGLDYLGYCQ